MCERTEWRTCRDSTKVDIGSLARLILEGAPAREIEDFVVFTTRVGLPSTLTEIGLSPEDTEELRPIAEQREPPRPNFGRAPRVVRSTCGMARCS